MRERTLTISSAAKTFSFTGWKIGWACAPPALAGRGADGQAVPHLRQRRPVPVRHRRGVAASATTTSTTWPTTCGPSATGCARASRRPASTSTARPAPTSSPPTSARSAPVLALAQMMATAPPSAGRCPDRCGVVAVPNVVFYDDAPPAGRWCASPSASATRCSTRRSSGSSRCGPSWPVKVAAVQHDIVLGGPARHLRPPGAADRRGGRRRGPAGRADRDVLDRVLHGERQDRRAGRRPQHPASSSTRRPSTACGCAARCPCEAPAGGRAPHEHPGPGRSRRRGAPLRQAPPVHLRRRAHPVRGRRPPRHRRRRRRPGQPVRLLRPALRRRVLGAWRPTPTATSSWPTGPPARRGPLADPAAGPGHREPGLRRRRQPGGGGRRPRTTPATA